MLCNEFYVMCIQRQDNFLVIKKEKKKARQLNELKGTSQGNTLWSKIELEK